MGRGRPQQLVAEGGHVPLMGSHPQRNTPEMLQFDGEARLRRERTQRNLGALRREGFQPARRHPSAARHRYNQRAHTDDELDEDGEITTQSFLLILCCEDRSIELQIAGR